MDFLGLCRNGSWSQIINQAQDYPRQARTVLEQSEADAQRVLAGTFALPDAYKEAKTKRAIDGYSPKKL